MSDFTQTSLPFQNRTSSQSFVGRRQAKSEAVRSRRTPFSPLSGAQSPKKRHFGNSPSKWAPKLENGVGQEVGAQIEWERRRRQGQAVLISLLMLRTPKWAWKKTTHLEVAEMLIVREFQDPQLACARITHGRGDYLRRRRAICGQLVTAGNWREMGSAERARSDSFEGKDDLP